MHKILVGGKVYSYIVGPYTIGIVTPTRVKHLASLKTVRFGKTGPTGVPSNGMPDYRVTPDEIVDYICALQLR